MQIVFIAGQAGMGKTTVASLIAEESFKLGFKPVLESFAKPIKEAAVERGFSKEDFPDKYRKFCQKLGALKRKQEEDYWVNRMRNRLLEIKQQEHVDINKGNKYWEHIVIVDDCRYLNEIKLGKEQNAFLMFLSKGRKAIKSGSWRNHESEILAKEIDNNKLSPFRELFSYILDNDVMYEDLVEHVKEIVPLLCGIEAESRGNVCNCPSCSGDSDFSGLELFKELLDSLEKHFCEEEEDEDEDEETN
jgi:dephospho-CoA kinase